jgi:hypothetical protein
MKSFPPAPQAADTTASALAENIASLTKDPTEKKDE